ncbi:helix-turn-helix domain-containing protein [Paraburkholderia dinghuensis]|uniref:Helix-turn-helix domain-containing protein n=1 Tax=Paraburkholderia dinghuensis TaxID=2305225 RepID=A0A3N6NKN3_9BURK|nr:helix-turn-helix domain-containing protein [Paraburkholderia dinghuensis]RQG99832.1 helix-turn-helix domain-containing protein [Paraburkholderia dinghuensis]
MNGNQQKQFPLKQTQSTLTSNPHYIDLAARHVKHTDEQEQKQLWFAGSPHRFGLVPAEVLLDKRLKPQDTRVLVALCLHVKPYTGICRVTRETLAEWLGIHIDTLSKVTSRLVEFGWLKKAQVGQNMPNRYELMLPKLDQENERVITQRWMSNEEYANRKRQLDQRTAEWNLSHPRKEGESVLIRRKKTEQDAASTSHVGQRQETTTYIDVPGQLGQPRVRERVRTGSHPSQSNLAPSYDAEPQKNSEAVSVIILDRYGDDEREFER